MVTVSPEGSNKFSVVVGFSTLSPFLIASATAGPAESGCRSIRFIGGHAAHFGPLGTASREAEMGRISLVGCKVLNIIDLICFSWYTVGKGRAS